MSLHVCSPKFRKGNVIELKQKKNKPEAKASGSFSSSYPYQIENQTDLKQNAGVTFAAREPKRIEQFKG